MTVTMNLGIYYIWIESLRIIEDDREDWLREALRMGTVYEMSRLTIAMSHAKNSTEGLLFPRNPVSKVEIPLVNFSGQEGDSIYVSKNIPGEYFEDGNLKCDPLGKRT